MNKKFTKLKRELLAAHIKTCLRFCTSCFAALICMVATWPSASSASRLRNCGTHRPNTPAIPHHVPFSLTLTAPQLAALVLWAGSAISAGRPSVARMPTAVHAVPQRIAQRPPPFVRNNIGDPAEVSLPPALEEALEKGESPFPMPPPPPPRKIGVNKGSSGVPPSPPQSRRSRAQRRRRGNRRA